MADDMAVMGRKEMLGKFRHLLNVGGVDITAAFEYDLLPYLLPKEDPAREDTCVPAS